mmetsp:Transcript_6361/g.14363  ORF Transcript_6361/g.14363 Transcript_6361/m.14363 type:complete len:101 (-) Transcript_6361:143-445(-)
MGECKRILDCQLEALDCQLEAIDRQLEAINSETRLVIDAKIECTKLATDPEKMDGKLVYILSPNGELDTKLAEHTTLSRVPIDAGAGSGGQIDGIHSITC